VEYVEKSKEIIVHFPDAFVEDEVEEYLHTKRLFRIPESNRLDDFREDVAYPYDNQTYLELAMCELYSHTDVWVNW
jgi:hypothetical protein